MCWFENTNWGYEKSRIMSMAGLARHEKHRLPNMRRIKISLKAC